MSNPDVAPWIALAGTMIALIARSTGETTQEVAQRVLAQCKADAADQRDETDAVGELIDAASKKE